MLVYSRENQTRPKLLVLACQSADMELRAAGPSSLLYAEVLGFGSGTAARCLFVVDLALVETRYRQHGHHVLDRLRLQMGDKSLFQVDPTLLVFSFWNKKRLLAKNLLGLPPRIFFFQTKRIFRGRIPGECTTVLGSVFVRGTTSLYTTHPS